MDVEAESYRCTLNMPNIKQALKLAEDATTITKAAARKSAIRQEFVQKLVQCGIDKNGSETIVRVTPGVHCELALLHHIRSHSLEVYPYLGVSKPPCGACKKHLDLYRDATNKPIMT